MQWFDQESVNVAPEVKVLFPNVTDIAMSRIVAASTTGGSVDTVNMVFVNAPKGLSESEYKKLTGYIGVRMKEGKVHLTLNPSNFPWPSKSAPSKSD